MPDDTRTSEPSAAELEHARKERLYRLAMKLLIGCAILGAYDTFVPDRWWESVGQAFVGAAEAVDALTESAGEDAQAHAGPTEPTPSLAGLPNTTSRVRVRPTPPPPVDLPQPLPESRALGDVDAFTPGPVRGAHNRVVVDQERGLIYMGPYHDWHLQALEPATGDPAFRFEHGVEPLLQVGDRLLALGERRLWILDVDDGAALYELPLDVLPPLNDGDFRPSELEVRHHVGDVAVVRLHVRRRPDHDPRAYADMDDREAAAQQAREHYAAAEAAAIEASRTYRFGVDLVAGEVVPCPAEDAWEPAGWDMNVAQVVVRFSGTAPQIHGADDPRNSEPRWRLGTRRPFREPPDLPAPAPPLPEPWPQPVVHGELPFEPGPASGRAGFSAAADAQRGVYHLLRDDGLVAVDPETGEVLYTHDVAGEPVAVVGNRLLARGPRTLWILDTAEGALVHTLEGEQLPPLLDSARAAGSVAATYAVGPVLRLETWEARKPEQTADAVERTPWETLRYAVGLDMSNGTLVEPPTKPVQRPGLAGGERVGRFRLDMHNHLARGRDTIRWDPPLWELPVRELRVREPPAVEAEER